MCMYVCMVSIMSVVVSLCMRPEWVTAVQVGKTALHWAAAGGHVSMTEYLVGHGADIEARDEVR